MTPIQDAVESFLTETGWGFERHASEPAVAVQIAGDNGRFSLYIQFDEGRKQLVAYALSPVRCPPARRGAMLELIARANWGLILGNFEMHLDTGDVRFKTSADVEAATFTPAGAAPILFPNVLSMDRYLPAIMAVIYSERSPEELVAEVEASSAS